MAREFEIHWGIRERCSSDRSDVTRIVGKGRYFVAYPPDLSLLKSAEQQQYHEDDENQAQSAAWIISPVTAVTPPWKGSNQEQHDNDDQDGS